MTTLLTPRMLAYRLRKLLKDNSLAAYRWSPGTAIVVPGFLIRENVDGVTVDFLGYRTDRAFDVLKAQAILVGAGYRVEFVDNGGVAVALRVPRQPKPEDAE